MKYIVTGMSLLLLVAGPGNATPQAPDLITYNGAVYCLHTVGITDDLPLGALWRTSTNRPALSIGPNGLMSTGCYRGYVAHWTVEDGLLYLTGLEAFHNDNKAELKTLFPDRFKDGRVKADWFTGTLTLSSKVVGPDNVPITMKFEKGKQTPNKVSDATSGSAAETSAHQD